MNNIVEELLKEISDKNIIDEFSGKHPIINYNIFNVLGIQNDERKLCRILADLLSPSGLHKQNSLYLSLFIDKILIAGGFFNKSYFNTNNYSNAKVSTEINITDKKGDNYGFIDIGIWIGKRFIPIEVKIYARDQDYQCYRYYTYAHELDPDTKVCYLSRKANSKPSDISLSDEQYNVLSKDQYFHISFEKEIYEWLSMCVEASKSRGLTLVITAIEQMMEIIKEFSEDTIEAINMDVVNTIMNSKSNMEAALLIEENIQAARIKMIEKVLKSLEDRIDSQYTELNLVKETKYYDYRDAVKTFYSSKNCSSYPGINYRCKNIKLSGGLELWFRVEIDYRLFAGFCVYDAKAHTQKDDYSRKTINEICSQLPDLELNREDWWVSWGYLPTGMVYAEDECPDFKYFGDRYAAEYSAYTSLFDADYFCEFVDKCILRISSMLDILR